MGLDMYLTARNSVCGAEFVKPEEKAIHDVCAKGAELLGLGKACDNLDLITISREVGYWRKANAIHNWFVVNAGNNEDDCQQVYVGRDQLSELRDICQQIIDGCLLVDGRVHNGTQYSPGAVEEIYEDDKVMTNTALAEELLPASSGFFFGGTDYDEYYMSKIVSTVAILDKALAMPEGVSFYYQASW